MTRRPPRRVVKGSWYDFPEYYDVAFMEDTVLEADFVVAGWNRFGKGRLKRILEPGCGGGRLVRELAGRGFRMVCFDDNPKSLNYLKGRLRERRLKAEVFTDDLADFSVSKPVDLAYCFCNTFRHLLSLDAAESHLHSIARALKPGGLHLLGMHIMPIDVDPEDRERWTAERDGVKAKTDLLVHKTFPRKRQELLRITMDVDAPSERIRVQSEVTLRLYNVHEIRRLLKRVPELELAGTCDFLYDVDDPITLDEYTSDVVFVLRRRTE